MGIQGLSKLLQDKCPRCSTELDLKSLFGRRIAIDASMSIYQFIIAMKGFENGQSMELANANGEVTSHLNGLLARTVRMMEEGLRPIYVFDGKPPELKVGATLVGRREKADEALKAFELAKEAGDDAAMEKMSKRTVRVTPQQSEESKRLLQLLGIPVVQAASEAEAQCVELVRSGNAWAVATEDMDALTFGCPILLRHFNYNAGATADKARKIQKFELPSILEESGFTMEMFIDLCILLGCDYTVKIPGIGPVKAWEGIERHKSIDEFVKSLDKTKYEIPEGFNFEGARELFKNPEVVPAADIKLEWKEPDAEGLKKFLVDEKLFKPERVDRFIARMRAALGQKMQGRIDSFFTVMPSVGKGDKAGAKRKREDIKAPSGSLGKTGSVRMMKKAVKKFI